MSRHDDPRPPVRVLVVDDDDALRVLVRLTLDFAGGFEIAGEAGDGTTALAEASLLHPDVIVLDLGLPDMSGLHVPAELCRVSPRSRIVVFSGLDEAGVQTAALAGGAASYVLKGGDTAVLVLALQAPPEGENFAHTSFDVTPDSVSAARRFIRDLCLSWGCESLTEHALIVVSELVTNAIVHARSSCRLVVRLDEHALRLELADSSAEAPNPRPVSQESEDGRGLLLIAALSAAWGVVPAEAGKVVWAEIPRTTATSASRT